LRADQLLARRDLAAKLDPTDGAHRATCKWGDEGWAEALVGVLLMLLALGNGNKAAAVAP
jgi:hypothetical protein